MGALLCVGSVVRCWAVVGSPVNVQGVFPPTKAPVHIRGRSWLPEKLSTAGSDLLNVNLPRSSYQPKTIEVNLFERNGSLDSTPVYVTERAYRFISVWLTSMLFSSLINLNS